MQLRNTGKVPADLGTSAGSRSRYTSLTGRSPSQATSSTPPLMLARQAVREEGALPECFHQRGQLVIGARPDLQLRNHRAQPSQLVVPVHPVSRRGKRGAAIAILGTATSTRSTRARTGSQLDQRCNGAGPRRSMPAFRSVVSVLLRALGDFSLHPQGRPCGRPPAAAVLGRQVNRRVSLPGCQP